MKKVEFYNGNDILGYNNKSWYFIIGNRSAGKSYFWKKYCINQFLKNGKQFLYIRTLKDELKGLKTFFNDMKIEFPDVSFNVIGTTLYINDEEAGFAYYIGEYQKLKSASYPNVNTILYDEFIPERGTHPDWHVHAAQNIYQSVARGYGEPIRKEVKFIFIANHVTFYNPYFEKFKLRWNPNAKIYKFPNGVAQVFYNESVANEIKDDEIGEMFSLINDGNDFANDGIFLLDNDIFIEETPKEKTYEFTIKHNGNLYGVYSVENGYHITDKAINNFPLRFVFSNDEFDLDYELIGNMRSDYRFKKVMKKYQKGNVTFKNQRSKKMWIELTQYS